MTIYFLLMITGLLSLALIVAPGRAHRIERLLAPLRGMKETVFTDTPTEARQRFLRILGVVGLLFSIFLAFAYNQQQGGSEIFYDILSTID